MLGNFGKENFGIFQSFTHQLLVASEIAIEAGIKFTKVYFAKCILACNSPKFSSIWYNIIKLACYRKRECGHRTPQD